MYGKGNVQLPSGMGDQFLCYVVHPWVFSFATHKLKLKFPCRTGVCEESGQVTKGWCKHACGVILLSIFIRLAVRGFGSDCWVIFIYIFI